MNLTEFQIEFLDKILSTELSYNYQEDFNTLIWNLCYNEMESEEVKEMIQKSYLPEPIKKSFYELWNWFSL